MPDSVDIYNVVVCSPSELSEDREAVARAIDAVNSYVAHEPFQIRVLRWERDVRPSIGTDAQDVVNTQIIDKADIGIALLGSRLGQATPRALSGTAEEVERLMARKSSGEKVDVLVFFKRSTAELNETYLNELSRVINFRETLRGRGVFWNEYSSSDDLEELIKLHLPRGIRALHGEVVDHSPNFETVIVKSSDTSSELEAAGSDPATLDSEIELLDAIDEFTVLLNQLTSGADDLSGQLGELTAKMQASQSEGRDPRRVRPLINESGAALNRQSDIVESGLPALKASTKTIVDSTLALAGAFGSEIEAKPEDEAMLADAIDGLREGIAGAVEATRDQAESIGKFPRLTSELNHARRRYVRCNAQLTEILEAFGVSLTRIVDDLRGRQSTPWTGPVA